MFSQTPQNRPYTVLFNGYSYYTFFRLPITHNETAEDAVMVREDDEKLYERGSYVVLLRLECTGFELRSVPDIGTLSSHRPDSLRLEHVPHSAHQ